MSDRTVNFGVLLSPHYTYCDLSIQHMLQGKLYTIFCKLVVRQNYDKSK